MNSNSDRFKPGTLLAFGLWTWIAFCGGALAERYL